MNVVLAYVVLGFIMLVVVSGTVGVMVWSEGWRRGLMVGLGIWTFAILMTAGITWAGGQLGW